MAPTSPSLLQRPHQRATLPHPLAAYQGGEEEKPPSPDSPAPATPPTPSDPAPAASLSDLPSYPPDFVRRRLLTFVGIVVG